MEPISLIIAALVAGAAAATKDVAGTAVKDAYEGLKALIKCKFRDDPIGKGLIDAEPEKIKKGEELLKDSIRNAGADRDEEIIKASQELLKQLKSEESVIGKYKVEFQGEVKVAQVGDRNTQTNTFGS